MYETKGERLRYEVLCQRSIQSLYDLSNRLITFMFGLLFSSSLSKMLCLLINHIQRSIFQVLRPTTVGLLQYIRLLEYIYERGEGSDWMTVLHLYCLSTCS